jgi:hypothetical protein
LPIRAGEVLGMIARPMAQMSLRDRPDRGHHVCGATSGLAFPTDTGRARDSQWKTAAFNSFR